MRFKLVLPWWFDSFRSRIGSVWRGAITDLSQILLRRKLQTTLLIVFEIVWNTSCFFNVSHFCRSVILRWNANVCASKWNSAFVNVFLSSMGSLMTYRSFYTVFNNFFSLLCRKISSVVSKLYWWLSIWVNSAQRIFSRPLSSRHKLLAFFNNCRI